VSAASGAKYVLHNSDNDHTIIGGDSAANFTYTQTVNAVRQGSATPTDDFEFKALTHVTRNANGEFTAEIVISSSLSAIKGWLANRSCQT
jgi:hypothetical protein